MVNLGNNFTFVLNKLYNSIPLTVFYFIVYKSQQLVVKKLCTDCTILQLVMLYLVLFTLFSCMDSVFSFYIPL